MKELILAFDDHAKNKGGRSHENAVAAAVKTAITIDWKAVQSKEDAVKENSSPYRADALIRKWWKLGKLKIPPNV